VYFQFRRHVVGMMHVRKQSLCVPRNRRMITVTSLSPIFLP
jgi:hypothetical protein